MDSSSKLQNNIETSISMNYSNEIGVLLISHGSSLPFSKNTFSEICSKFKNQTGLNAEVGYMKVEQPSLPQAINTLKENAEKKGFQLKKILALPVFLADGIHTKIDIPTLLGLEPLEVDPRYPDGNYPKDFYLSTLEKADFDGEINYLNPIGADKDLLNFINKRVSEALENSSLDKDEKTGVLLVSHGSRLKYNKEFISSLFELYKDETSYLSNYGFMELLEPSIPQAATKLIDEDIKRLIVVPVFIAPGVHTTHDIPIILGIREDDGEGHSHSHFHDHSLDHIHFHGEILYCEPIGSDNILIDILEKKLKESL